MRFDTVIIGGGLAGLTAGICLQKAGQDCAIVSTGQNALHFFSGSFESLEEAPARLAGIFEEAGIRLHYQPGVRLMPMGTFRPAALSLEDVDILPDPAFSRKALIVSIAGYQDFFAAFLAEGLEKQGTQCRIHFLQLPEMAQLMMSPSEMRSVQIARTMDRMWEKVVGEIKVLLQDEDTVILPQVFGLQDTTVPGRIRQAVPARVIFAGTLPPSVPGIRTQQQLKRRYEVLGGTYLAGDEVIQAHVHDGVVHSVATRNLDSHYLEAGHFILATGGYFSKGLRSNPFRIYEPVFGLDVDASEDRNAWYDAAFAADQPYLKFGVRTDPGLRALRDGVAFENLYAVGSLLGATRPELGSGAGLAIRSAFQAVDQILRRSALQEDGRPAGQSGESNPSES